MSYDAWKTHSPNDERLGPVCAQCGADDEELCFEGRWLCFACWLDLNDDTTVSRPDDAA
jgi:hypothetical protein